MPQKQHKNRAKLVEHIEKHHKAQIGMLNICTAHTKSQTIPDSPMYSRELYSSNHDGLGSD